MLIRDRLQGMAHEDEGYGDSESQPRPIPYSVSPLHYGRVSP